MSSLTLKNNLVKNTLLDLQDRVETELKDLFASRGIQNNALFKAMNYSILQGGKRIRPALVYLFGQCFKQDLKTLDNAAMAVELVHGYSLIHDDLPAMDNDDLRRGQASCHIAFDEATAILAGDALQSLAFEVITLDESLSTNQRLETIQILSQAIGDQGMCLGQQLDLAAEGKSIDLKSLDMIHHYKTGRLITASCMIGALIGGASTIELKNIKAFGDCLGQGFQIRDDLLDIVSDSTVLGKPQGSDKKNNKRTYCDFYDVPALENLLDDIQAKCFHLLEALPLDTILLRDLTGFVFKRNF